MPRDNLNGEGGTIHRANVHLVCRDRRDNCLAIPEGGGDLHPALLSTLAAQKCPLGIHAQVELGIQGQVPSAVFKQCIWNRE